MAITLQSRSIETATGEDIARCERVFKRVEGTSLERVLRASAYDLNAKVVARRLGIKPSTVVRHRTRLLKICHKEWPDVQNLNTHFLFEKFSLFAFPDDGETIEERKQRCRRVMERATPCQRKVLREFVAGLKAKDVAKRLGITVTTVRSHATELFKLCQEVWSVQRSGYHFLCEKFAGYDFADYDQG